MRKIIYINLLLSLPAILLSLVLVGIYKGSSLKSKVALEGDNLIVSDSLIGFKPASNSYTRRCHYKGNANGELCYEVINGPYSNRIPNSVPRKISYSPDDYVFIGGSFAWGHGLEQEDTFSHIVSGSLGKNYYNLSMGSYGTLHAIQSLDRLPDTPKTVFYGFTDYHIKRNLTGCAPSYSPFCLAVSRLGLDSSGEISLIYPNLQFLPLSRTVDYLNAAASENYVSKVLVSIPGYNHLLDVVFRPTPADIGSLDAFEFMLKHLRSSFQGDLYVINLNLSDSPMFRLLAKNFSDARTVFVDPAINFKAYLSSRGGNELLVHPHDGHPSAKAHSLYADAILNALSHVDARAEVN